MYTPKYFEEDRKHAVDIMQRYSFATLLTIKEDLPQLSHLPFHYQENTTTEGILISHMARANPQWRSFKDGGNVTMLFQGPHAYVSPRWYEPQPDNVPTWNYAVVHAHGKARILGTHAEAYPALQALIRKFDPSWILALSEKDKAEMLNEIVVFEVSITRLEAKFKLSQNRSEKDQARVAEQLKDSIYEHERETGALMERLRLLKMPDAR